MDWHGKRVVITRAQDDAEKVANDLKKKGAIPIIYPCIDIELLTDSPQMNVARMRAQEGYYDWVIFTSRNACRSFFLSLSVPLPLSFQTAAIGESTGNALPCLPTFTSTKSTAISMAHEIPIKPGDKVLLPQSAIAKSALADILKQRGCHVDVITAYQNTIGKGGPNLAALQQELPVDVIQFASPSAVDNFKKRLQFDGGTLKQFASTTFSPIGPTTEKACIALRKQAGYNLGPQ